MRPFALILIACLAFANGSNDVSKSVATLVGGGVTNYGRALRWGAVWTAVGAFLGAVFATSLAQRFARSLGAEASHNAAISLAVVFGSLVWVAFSSRFGLPVSTTHAITGAVLGVGWIAEGLKPLARTDMLKGFVAPLLASPIMALGLAFVLRPVVARVGRWLDARCVCLIPEPTVAQIEPAGSAVASGSVNLVLDRTSNCERRAAWSWNFSADQAHWVSSALVSLSRGMNDAPKIWALVFPLFFLGGVDRQLFLPFAIVLVTLAMGVGSWVAGHRVTEILAERVTRMSHHEGFAANLATALLVVGASRLGLPVSTTHVSSGAIVGVGLSQGRAGVHWRVFTQMAIAWLVTLPVAAIVAVACYWMLT